MSECEVSPMALDPSEVPVVSITDFLFNKMKNHPPEVANQPALVEATSGDQVLFGELEEQSRRIASALARSGLRKGDILYYVTYNMTQVYVVMLAAWRIGVAVRGCYQSEGTDEYERQMRESNVLVAVLDPETAPKVKAACQRLEWRVKLISVGADPVSGATSFDQLLSDDGSAFPSNVEINPHEDIVVIPNTSGSTGFPKGAMHTHYSIVSSLYGLRHVPAASNSQLTLSSNFAGSNCFGFVSSLYNGKTYYLVSKYERENFINTLLKCKPNSIMIYPYLASWLARSPEFTRQDLSFLKVVGISGAVLDAATAKLFSTALPNVTLVQIYAMSEFFGITMSAFDISHPDDAKRIKTCEFEGKTYTSSGKPFPYTRLKIVDPETAGKHLGRMKSGEIVAQSPCVMKGYLVHNDLPNTEDFDSDGWYHTGDLGFLDSDGCLYVQERKSFNFKYYMFVVSPSDVEAVVSQHPAVREVGIIGVPNTETVNLTRAYVVLKPGLVATEDELKDFVAKRLQHYLHLHGGVRFLENLPVNRGGKVDRIKLRDLAMLEMQQQDRKCNPCSLIN